MSGKSCLFRDGQFGCIGFQHKKGKQAKGRRVKRHIQSSETDKVEVLQEDQGLINFFGRLNHRFEELKDSIFAKEVCYPSQPANLLTELFQFLFISMDRLFRKTTGMRTSGWAANG